MATAFPYSQAFADRSTRGDYINLFATFDLTFPRLKQTLFLGTRWGDENAKLIPAPGDPYYLNYTYDPMIGRCRATAGAGAARGRRRHADGATAADPPGRCCRWLPPPTAPQTIQDRAGPRQSQIFAGPFGADAAGAGMPRRLSGTARR